MTRTAVILGASSRGGLGEAMARRLVKAGMTVILSSRRADELEALATEIGCLWKTCDIGSDDELAALAAFAVEKGGSLDLAVNAVGMNSAAPIADLDRATLARLCDIHFIGSLMFIKAMAAKMQAGASIITLSSLTAAIPGPGRAAYAGTKAAVDYAVKIAALEYGGQGIRINAVAPGLIRTPMTDAFLSRPGVEAAYKRETPLGRMTTPEDVAAAVEWLASPDCFMTGQLLQVNGGASLTRLPRADELG